MVVDQADLDARQCGAHRAGVGLGAGTVRVLPRVLPRVRGRDAQGAGDDRGRLGEAVALVHRDAGGPVERRDLVGVERCRAGEHQPDRGEPLGEPLEAQQVPDDGGCDRQHRDPLGEHQVEDGVRVIGVDEHQRGPVPQHAAEDRVQAVDVEERQRAQHDVAGADHRRLDAGDLFDVGQQGAVAEHHRARAAGGARGVEQRRQALGVDQRGVLAAALGPQVVVGALAGSQRRTGHDDAGYDGALEQLGRQRPPGPVGGPGQLGLEPRDAGAHHAHGRLVDQHQPRTGVGEHPGDLLGGGPRVQRDRDGLHAQDREVGDDQLGAVDHGQRHPVAGDDSGRDQPVGDPCDLLLQRRPRQAGRTVDESDRVGHVGGCRRHEVCQRGADRGRGGCRGSGGVGCSVLGHALDLGTAAPCAPGVVAPRRRG